MPKILERPPKRDPNAPPPTDEEVAQAFVRALSELMAPLRAPQPEAAETDKEMEGEIEIVADDQDGTRPGKATHAE